jgi:hypothetical protein
LQHRAFRDAISLLSWRQDSASGERSPIETSMGGFLVGGPRGGELQSDPGLVARVLGLHKATL